MKFGFIGLGNMGVDWPEISSGPEKRPCFLT